MLKEKAEAMHFQILNNFIHKRLRQNDIYVPAMLLYLVKNGGRGRVDQISRLIYIFDFRRDLADYEMIVENFCAVILKEYNIVDEPIEGEYRLKTWPLSEQEIEETIKACMQISNGFFSHLRGDAALRKAS
jgi:hypothetical protein